MSENTVLAALRRLADEMTASGQLSVTEVEMFSEFLNHQQKFIKDAEWKQKWSELE